MNIDPINLIPATELGRNSKIKLSVCDTEHDLYWRMAIEVLETIKENNEKSEACTAEEFLDSPTRVLPISRETKTINCFMNCGGDLDAIPKYCITVGMKEMFMAKKVRMCMPRDWNAGALRKILHGGETDTANRKISNTAAATRVIGVQMYAYNALGFLQWAYNYYYDQLSNGFCDPSSNPAAYKLLPGIAYLCYPIFARGKSTVVPSVREKLMGEAMDDLRALKLLESKIGRDATLALCEKHLGKIDTHTVPSGETLRLLREDVNQAIKNIL